MLNQSSIYGFMGYDSLKFLCKLCDYWSKKKKKWRCLITEIDSFCASKYHGHSATSYVKYGPKTIQTWQEKIWEVAMKSWILCFPCPLQFFIYRKLLECLALLRFLILMYLIWQSGTLCYFINSGVSF